MNIFFIFTLTFKTNSMKKIYFSLLLIAGTLQISNAQLSLTKAANEPVIGDINNRQQYDSTTVVPKATGSGLNWSFMSLTPTGTYVSSTYTNVASTPSAASFPNATLAEDQGGGDYTFYKSTPTTLEFQGIQFPGIALNFSNTGIYATWPVNFGYNATDPFAGSAVTGSITTNFTGNANINGAGTGTVVMPGGLTLTNCLQVVSTIDYTLTQGSLTITAVEKEFNYYHSSNKFPVLAILYKTEITGTVTTKTFEAKVNTAIVAGLNAHEISNNLTVFPNPANGVINISCDNNSNEAININLTNILGSVVKKESFGAENKIRVTMNVSDLPKGIYFINVNIGNTSSVKKIVID